MSGPGIQYDADQLSGGAGQFNTSGKIHREQTELAPGLRRNFRFSRIDREPEITAGVPQDIGFQLLESCGSRLGFCHV